MLHDDMNAREHALWVHQRLLDFYGHPEWRAQLPPLDELVATILSQNTNDNNSWGAYEALRRRFPTWEAVRDAPEGEVIAAIRSAGLANQKGPRIQTVLREISAQRGKLSLDFLADLPVEDARAWLLGFKGVGPKTASIVLLFALGKPAFPVDTHVHRVTGRLGLRPEGMNADRAHEHLAALFPPDAYYPVHLNLIRLGREICGARRPNHAACPLQELCAYFQAIRSEGDETIGEENFKGEISPRSGEISPRSDDL